MSTSGARKKQPTRVPLRHQDRLRYGSPPFAGGFRDETPKGFDRTAPVIKTAKLKGSK